MRGNVSEESPGKIAAAQAVLDAENAAEAMQRLVEIARSHPDDGAALEYCCDMLRDNLRLEEAERIARDWRARAPADIRAHVQLVVTLFARGDAGGAREAIDAFRKAAPQDRDALDYLETMYRSRFGMARELPLRENTGRLDEHGWRTRMAGYVADKRSMSEEIIEGEFTRRMGDDSAALAAHLALLCFRSFRFAKCRKYARLALEKQPGMPEPTELVYLSWLVLFPPFLLAQLYLFLWFSLQRASMVVQACAFFFMATIGMLPVMWSVVMLTLLMNLAGLNAYATAPLMLAWAGYAPFIGLIARNFGREKPKQITLADY